jgi:hypothetical protein
MSFIPKDPALADHLAWLGYVQPEGLVVSAPALADAQAIIDRAQLGDLQRRFNEQVVNLPVAAGEATESQPGIENLQGFVTAFLGWQYELLVGVDPSCPLPDSLTVSLPEFQETLHPSFAVKNPQAKEGTSTWLLLVQSHPATVDLDKPAASSERNWHASPSKKFERLLRETGVPIGLLFNGTQFRLIYAPHKENSGALTFPVAAMTEFSGRLILGAFQLLLGSWTLFNAPSDARLPALLQRSRDYQASVSEILAEQVLHALYELLRGFEAADKRVQGKLLRELAAKDPHDIYGGLVAVLLRLVFILFAEDRGLLPGSGLYVRNYAVRGLFERLRADAERYPDTMDHRFGAWAQLLALFRIIHGGCKHPDLKMPARAGHLFDPDRYPFLEGRATQSESIGALPLVSDGTIYRILQKLCILEGERVSYRTLDVEEIGSVYQTIMGFSVETAAGTAIALKGKRKNGGVPASPVISLEQLLASPAKDRAKWLKENADTELGGEADKRLKTAVGVDDLLVALGKRMDLNATPAPVAKGGLVLQPTDERRRSGSHYTPRSFTEPIVHKTLEPILKRFGEQPTPAQILELKICDIAVGSAAFLVETCRQLADVLVRAWRTHGGRPPLPPDETEELLAMRAIAQRCLYGVDRNPMAVDLAKLSLWLATLAKDHPFTFLDHAIRCGDSLVGLTRRQIECFTWKTGFTTGQLWEQEVRKRTASALRERQNLLGLGDDYGTPQLKREKLEKTDELLDLVRFIGDAAVAAFFAADKDKTREAKRVELAERIADYLGKGEINQRPTDEVKGLRGGKPPVLPFHWEIEFPEVFDCEKPGFDAFVGNPPFVGGRRVRGTLGDGYFDWLLQLHAESGGNSDLVAHFFRRAFDLLRADGCFGLIATNTIGQADTRATGLRWICVNGGTIFAARKRLKWPGQAAVAVSVIHIAKSRVPGPFFLDGREVPIITAYLFHAGGHETPNVLRANEDKSFVGAFVLGMGFTFDDTDPEGVANPLSVMREAIEKNARNTERIWPYLGGEEVNDSPTQSYHRFVLNFADYPLRREATEGSWIEADQKQRDAWLRNGVVPKDYPGPVAADWPELLAIAEAKVKPERTRKKANGEFALRDPLPRKWWIYADKRPALYKALSKVDRALVCSLTSKYYAWAFKEPHIVFAHTCVVFPLTTFAAFATLQSQSHAAWGQFVSSTLEDRLRYTPSDCFETFPFPIGWETSPLLEAVGREYYEFRADLMTQNKEGLTKTYNRFHDPDDSSPDILKFRELHAKMDAAVLTAYGWQELVPKCVCKFILEYEDDDDDESESSGKRKKKKPYRYRWPDEVRDEVLARLLKLNAERAEEERIAAGSAAATQKPKPQKGTKRKTVPQEQIGLTFEPRAKQPRKHSRGINFKRGAIASYAVNRLCDRPEFGRIEMEKVFYGAQCIIGIDLEMDFKPFENGPFDEEIHKIESLAGKQQWFDSVPRQGGVGTEYHRGMQIEVRCGAAKAILGDKLAEFDRILDWIGRMDSAQTGIWTTVHFVWNNLILTGKAIADDAIVKGFYEFHEAKRSIEEWRVRSCIKWLRDNKFVPTGIRPHIEESEPERELPTDFRLPASQPLLYTTNLVVTLLSEAGGSLAWLRLLDGFVLATHPKLMQRLAPAEFAALAKKWAGRWNETVPDGLLLPSLNQLGAQNLTVTKGNNGLVFHLLDGPRRAATEDVRYDAWLALHVAATLAPDAVQIPERAKWTAEAEKLVHA